jgi:hypothetical protein
MLQRRCKLMSVVPGLTLTNSVAASEGQATERSRQGRDVGFDAVLRYVTSPISFRIPSFKPRGGVPGGGRGTPAGECRRERGQAAR